VNGASLLSGVYLKEDNLMADDMLKIWRDYLEAWNSHDWDRISAFVSDDCIYKDMGAGRAFYGIREIKAYFDEIMVWSADVSLESKSFISFGDRIAWEWIMSGTHTGDIPGMKATGKKYSVPGVSIAELQDGKLIWNTDYWNMTDFLQQIGWLPGAPANVVGRLIMRLFTKR
jgi:steroid delta-isomerase-like uncharacterized protein